MRWGRCGQAPRWAVVCTAGRDGELVPASVTGRSDDPRKFPADGPIAYWRLDEPPAQLLPTIHQANHQRSLWRGWARPGARTRG